MANKIKYGLRNVYYAVATEGAGGVLSYATPVAIPGAVNLALSQEGDTNPFYADDVVYFQTTSNNGYSGTLEIALVPDSFKKDVLGEQEDDNDLLVEYANVTPSEFALLFEFQGDDKATRHVLYRCTVSRPDVNGATKEEAIEPQTETLNITAIPRINDELVKASCPYSSAKYSTWFTTLTEPVFT